MTLTEEPTEEDPGDLFSHVDWNRTKAYSLGFASIYINLKGREGQGIVEPEEKHALVTEIMEKLRKLTDGRTKVVTDAYRGEEIYSGVYAADAPDIVIGFAPGYRMSWQSAVGGATPEVIFDNGKEWIGDHLVDRSHVPAVVFTSFKIGKDSPKMQDIAPTVLSLLDVDIPEGMEGESLVGK